MLLCATLVLAAPAGAGPTASAAPAGVTVAVGHRQQGPAARTLIIRRQG